MTKRVCEEVDVGDVKDASSELYMVQWVTFLQ